MGLASRKKEIAIGAVILILLLVVFWVWYDGRKMGKLVEAGNQALQDRNWQAAIDAFSKAQGRAPNSPDVLYGLVKANVELGIQDYRRGVTHYQNRFRQAEGMLDKMMQYASDRIEANVVKGQIYYYLGRYVQSEKAFQDVLKRDHNNFVAALGLGESLYQQSLQDSSRLADTLAALQNALKIRPNNETALRLLAELSLSQYNLPAAAEYVATLQEQGGARSGETLKTIGKVLFLQGQYSEAREYLEKATQGPSKITAVNERELVENRYLLGTCCFYLRDFPNAEENLRQARRSSQQEVYPLTQWAQFLTFDSLKETDPDAKNRKMANAIKTLEEASKRATQDTLVLHLLAQAYFRVAELDQARETLQRLVNTEPGNIPARFDLANVQHRLGDDVQAIRNYQEILALTPNFELASFNLGSIFLKRAGYNEAVEYLKQAVESDSEFLAARLNLAQAYLAQKQFIEAKKEYEKVLQENPDEFQAISGLGMIYQREGDLVKAESMFQKVSEMAKQSDTGYLQLAKLYLQQGNASAAISQLEKAVKLNPQNYSAQIQLGNTYLETGRSSSIQSAITLFESLRSNPNRSVVRDALTGLALSMLAKGDFNGAEKYFDELLNLPNLTPKEQGQIYVNKGNAYLKQNQDDKARDNYEKALSLDATLAEANYNLGRLYQKQGKYADARRKYIMAFSADPSLAAAQYNLGVLYESRNDYTNAIKHYRTAIEADPTLTESYLNLANLYCARDQKDDALKLLSEAKALNPNLRLVRDALAYLYYNMDKFDEARAELNYSNPSPQALRLQGMMNFQQGQYSEAVTQLKKALTGEGASSSLMTLTNLGAALMEIGNYPEAERYLDQALLKDKNSVDVLNNLGALYVQTGRYEKAEAVFQRSLQQQAGQTEIQAALEKISQLE